MVGGGSIFHLMGLDHPDLLLVICSDYITTASRADAYISLLASPGALSQPLSTPSPHPFRHVLWLTQTFIFVAVFPFFISLANSQSCLYLLSTIVRLYLSVKMANPVILLTKKENYGFLQIPFCFSMTFPPPLSCIKFSRIVTLWQH